MSAVLAYTVREACEATGVGRSTLYLLLKSGALRGRKNGKRTLILASDLHRWLEKLPELSAPGARTRRPPKRGGVRTLSQGGVVTDPSKSGYACPRCKTIMDEVVRIAPLESEPGLIGYECPACCYVTSVLLQSKGSQKRRSSEK